MSRTGVFLLLILGAALVVETAYQLATGGFIGSEAGRYPTAQAFAREAGLAPAPAPPRAAVAKPVVVPPVPSASSAPAAQPAQPAVKPATAKVRAPHRPHPPADADRAPPSDAPAPPSASPPRAPIVAPY